MSVATRIIRLAASKRQAIPAVIAASRSGVEIDVVIGAQKFGMHTVDGEISGPYAAYRYLARAGAHDELLGSTIVAQATVDQWIEFSRNELTSSAEVDAVLGNDAPMLAALVNMGVRGTIKQ